MSQAGINSIAGAGGVIGPSSSTDNALARFDGTSGKLLQNGIAVEDDNGNITVATAYAGAALTNTISNTSATNASHVRLLLQTNANTTCAPWIEFANGTSPSYIWGLNGPNQACFLNYGTPNSVSPLGGTTSIWAQSDGNVYFINRTTFVATANAQANVTGAGAAYVVQFATANKNVGGGFNVGTGRYTAPGGGQYCLAFNIGIEGIAAGMTTCIIDILTSNRNYRCFNVNAVNMANAAAELFLNGCVYADMDAGDTAEILVTISGGGGDTADIAAGGQFMGGLVS